MSNLLSTQAMVAECQRRVPIQLTNAFWMRKLNEAYRWISQKGNFIWTVKYASPAISVPIGNSGFQLPTDCDTGKPMWLAGPMSNALATQLGVMKTLIPYKPWDESLDQQYAEVTAPPGLYSCWTFSYDPITGSPPAYTYWYRATLYPASAAPTGGTGAFNFLFYYHMDVASAELAESATVFFPTPNSFDNLLIELAEAEVRRIYGLAGWDIIQKRAESAIVTLLDSYRSTKNLLNGMIDQQKQANEAKMMAQERS